MAKQNLVAPREPSAQPAQGSTRKDQKGYQLPQEYSPQQTNQEFDRLHERINKIVVEATALTDLASTATLAQTIERVNQLAEILRNSGLLRRD